MNCPIFESNLSSNFIRSSIFFCAIFFSSVQSYTNEVSVVTPGYCENKESLWKEICGARIEKENKIERYYNQQVAKYRSIGVKSINLQKISDIFLLKNDVRIEKTIEVLDRIERQIFTDLKITRIDIENFYEKVKHHFINGIHRQKILTDEQKQFLAKEVGNIKFWLPSQYLKHHRHKKGLSFIKRICRVDGLRDNATALSADDESKQPPVVMLCLGKWVMAKFHSPKDPLSALFGTIAHELGHHFSYFRYPFWFEKFKSCIENNYMDWWKNFEPKKLVESTSDLWAAEALASLKMQEDSINNIPEILKNSLATYCRKVDFGGGYPPADFRVVHPLFHPDIHRKIGCSPSKGVAARTKSEKSRKFSRLSPPKRKNFYCSMDGER